MPAISCLKSPALFPLLIQALVISNSVPSWPSSSLRRYIWSQPRSKAPLLGNLCFTCSMHAQEGLQLRTLAL